MFLLISEEIQVSSLMSSVKPLPGSAMKDLKLIATPVSRVTGHCIIMRLMVGRIKLRLSIPYSSC